MPANARYVTGKYVSHLDTCQCPSCGGWSNTTFTVTTRTKPIQSITDKDESVKSIKSRRLIVLQKRHTESSPPAGRREAAKRANHKMGAAIAAIGRRINQSVL